ncbi:MAG TPA: hypothetical protein VLL48_10590, partial [Longimicrobiales bacterium]|nr:hypothetical protein [Longimicrobiales bacterium]
MKVRLACRIGLLCSVLPLIGIGARVPSSGGSGGWADPAPLPPSLQERSFGSAVPCAVPLAWRVTDVDPRFELGERAAEDAVRAAAALWERAVGRELFPHEPGSGFPVRFDFDDRQALVQMRRRLEGELRAEG